MVVAQCRLILVVIAVATSQALAARSRPAEDPIKRETSTDCFLHRVDDGSVWLGEPLVSLGMIGVYANPPQYRLSDDLASSLEPLINRFPSGESKELWCWHRIPRGREPGAPTILVTFQRTSRPIVSQTQPKEEAAGGSSRRPKSVHEIISAEVLQVEIVPRPWLDAWDKLDEALKEIVDVSKAAPDPDKRKRLAEAIQTGGEALSRMYEAVPPEEKVRAVRAAVPKARVVRNLERLIEWGWGGHLRRYASALGIQPPKPLPPEPKMCMGMDRVKILLESKSPADFIARIKQSCSPEALDEVLTYSMLRAVVHAGGGRSSQPIYVWQIEHMPLSDFEMLQEEVKGHTDRPSPHPVNVPTPEEEAKNAAATLKSKWGVTVRPADADVSSKMLILRGMVVDEVAATGSPIGLQRGDVIIDYNTTYDLRGAEEPFSWREQELSHKTNIAGDLRVLRAGQLVTIHLEGGK